MAGDTIGMELVEQLSRDESWRARDDIEWLVLERPGAALLHYFEGVETVVIVDALDSDKHEGVVRIEPEQLLNEPALLSSHGFGVAEALQLAQALGQMPERLLIYGVVEAPGLADDIGAALWRDIGWQS